MNSTHSIDYIKSISFNDVIMKRFIKYFMRICEKCNNYYKVLYFNYRVIVYEKIITLFANNGAALFSIEVNYDQYKQIKYKCKLVEADGKL